MCALYVYSVAWLCVVPSALPIVLIRFTTVDPKQAAPELWSNSSLRVITEYGRSLTAKAGWAVSRVEYASDNQPFKPTSTTPSSSLPPPPPSSSTSLPPSFLRTAILHVGADALLRECYCPTKFPHRVGVFE